MSIIKDAVATQIGLTMTHLIEIGMSDLAWRLWRLQVKRSLLHKLQVPLTALHKRVEVQAADLRIDLEYVLILHPMKK